MEEDEGPSEDRQDNLARQEPSRRKGWSSHGIQQLHPGLFVRSLGIAAVGVAGTYY